MKIMALLPGEGTLIPEAQSEVRKYLMQFASPGTEIEVFRTKGTKEILRGRDIAMIAPSAVETAIQGEKSGFDAIILNGI